MDQSQIRKCVVCGLITAVVVTELGIFCEKCLHEVHKHPHLAYGGMSYDWPINEYISISAIEATTTGASAIASDILIKYIDFE